MAYGLKFLKINNIEEWKSIAERAINQAKEYPFTTYFLSGTLSTCPDEERKNNYTTVIRDKLKTLAKSDDPINKYEAFVALGNFADQNDSNFVKEEFLNLYNCKDITRTNNTKDILSAISYALLKTSKSKK